MTWTSNDAQKLASNIIQSLTAFESFANNLFGLKKDIEKDDRLAVIIVCAAAEVILDFLLETLCKHGSTLSKMKRHLPFIGKIIVPSEMKVIDDELFKNLKVLKELRDLAAHNPAEDIKWKGKFAFNKKSGIYKKFVKDFGREPKSLLGQLFCVWNTVYRIGTRACTRKYLDQTKDKQKQ